MNAIPTRYQSKGHQTVFERGWKAKVAGEPRRAPYADLLGGRNGNIVSGARGYNRAWLAGYDAASTQPRR